MRSINFISVITLTLIWATSVKTQESATATRPSSSQVTVNPAAIDLNTKSLWCQGQLDTCGRLCDGETSVNDCSTFLLGYNCLCASNSTAPGLQYYMNTIPTFLCQQEFVICNAQEVSAAGKARCLATSKANCGSLDPADYTQKAQTTSSLTSTTSSSRTTNSLTTSTSTASSSIGETSSSSSSASSPSSSTSATSTVSGSAINTSTPKEGGEGLGFPAKIAIGVTIPLVFIIAIIALLWFLRRRRKAETHESIHGAELHGDSRAHELPGHKIAFIHEVGAEENEKDVKFVPPLVAEISNEENFNSTVIATSRGDLQELPDEAVGATQSVPIAYEMPLDGANSVFGAQPPRSEMPASPVVERGEAARANSHARELSEASTSAPRLPTQRKELPATPVVTPIRTSQPPTVSAQNDEEELERERQALNQRRAKITAERERLRRMQELDEEESGIEHRLNTLGRPKNG